MIIKNSLKNIFLKIYLYKFWFILTLEIYAFIVIFSYVSSNWQVVNDVNSLSFKKSNVIVLLGAGVIKDKHGNFIPSFYAYSRINKVASIYNMCKISKKKCVIIISGGNKNKKYLTEAYIYFVNLVNIGVPYKDIILEDKSKNTSQNAYFVSQILKKYEYDALFLVSSAIHLRRANIYFKENNVTPKLVNSDYFAISFFNPFAIGNIMLLAALMHEGMDVAKIYFDRYIIFKKY